MADSIEEKDEQLLQYAIDYTISHTYPPDLSKDKKRAVRRKAATLTVEKGEVFLRRHQRRVKVVTSGEEQKRIVNACHSEPTSGHFGVNKTWRRVAERFYWKGMSDDVKDLVRFLTNSVIILYRLVYLS